LELQDRWLRLEKSLINLNHIKLIDVVDNKVVFIDINNNEIAINFGDSPEAQKYYDQLVDVLWFR